MTEREVLEEILQEDHQGVGSYIRLGSQFVFLYAPAGPCVLCGEGAYCAQLIGGYSAHRGKAVSVYYSVCGEDCSKALKVEFTVLAHANGVQVL